jgi:hypothetical protein
MGTLLPIERLKVAWLRVKHGIPNGEAAQCQYGAAGDSMVPQCEVIVEPYCGYRDNGLVFCTDQHAAEDQETYIL